MHALYRSFALSLALVVVGPGCDKSQGPAAKGAACNYAADTPTKGCAADLYCHPTRDSEGALVLEANGPDKKSAVGTCQAKLAADAACTKDSVCVTGHTCGFKDPAVDEGHCVPNGADVR
ncbi:MAG: hypothetical protein ACRBN8_21505 [Nannocystales bacterium]